jgi:FixJ family two-component response regulator
MKIIIILDDEPRFIEPILEKIVCKYGENAYKYFQNPEDFFDALERGEFIDASCFILDMFLMITDTEIKNDSLIQGIMVANELRKSGNKTPIVFYTVISNSSIIDLCEKIEAVEIISKIDRYGFKKLFQFIEKFNIN